MNHRHLFRFDLASIRPLQNPLASFNRSLASNKYKFSTYCLNKKPLQNIDVHNKRVIIRVDFNVPFDKITGDISNDQRIREALLTIKLALQKGASKVVLLSHLGRPKGVHVPKLSLASIAEHTFHLLGCNGIFVPECVGKRVEQAVQNAPEGSVLLLENLRFHIEEEGKGEDSNGNKIKADEISVKSFRKNLTRLGDVYINDAFGTSHRAHSSMVGIDLPERVAGLLLQKELQYFGKALNNPSRPFLAILGGAKVADKIQLIHSLLDRVDELVIGGGMAFTFKRVLDNTEIGNSIFDSEGAKLVTGIMQKAAERNIQIHLPVDFVAAKSIEPNAETQVVSDNQGIPLGWLGLDIGPNSAQEAVEAVKRAGMVIWNGPMGMFEFEKFSHGTKAVLDAVVTAAKENGCISIIGGGDTATCVKKYGKEDGVSHVSTGGGASLELLEGKVLPGVAVLTDEA